MKKVADLKVYGNIRELARHLMSTMFALFVFGGQMNFINKDVFLSIFV